MVGHLDSGKISFDCPQCGKKINTTVGRIKTKPKFSCSCGLLIDANKAAKGFRGVDKKLAEFQQAIERLNKRR